MVPLHEFNLPFLTFQGDMGEGESTKIKQAGKNPNDLDLSQDIHKFLEMNESFLR